ncbi:glycosyltransferase family 4 protein [Empedobacter falsenii]|uniref:glycosyltransferase family 4 protein n=1 Tax=Empedobacter falsenii TaxID=343874 RepID=UPI001C574B56|nr:glycosyltransferase family 4 protein [Empedobacter falsenii]MBW1619745.1 glycosyltransferase family 4 protein [Empedobacter falsenii]
MKLLYVTNGINGAGGLERVLAIKTSYLSEKLNYEVHIVSLNETQFNPFYTFLPDIHLHSIMVKGNLFNYIWNYIFGIKRIIKQVQPDIISVCDDGLKGFFLPIILGNKIPTIYERHISKEVENTKGDSFLKKKSIQLKWAIMATLAKKFDAFVVLTNGNIKEWPNLRNLKVIPNPTSFYPEQSAALNNKKVIAVGKQGYQKGYDQLLRAWEVVCKENSDWELEIYGKEEPKEGLHQLAMQLGIQNRVSFYPPTSSIEEKYLESSIYVMSSRFEGFGMVLIEAMSCGLPCVSFDCPHGPSDIISDKEDGFLVPNGDVQALANALQILILDENKRIIMGRNAKDNAKRYLPEQIMPVWDELFKKIKK